MLIQQLLNSNKYDVKCPYAMTPVGICIHNTANDAPAKNEIFYMSNNTNEVSFHIAIDDIESIQAIPFNRNSWHAGDGGNGPGNRSYIAIEICYSKSGGERFVKAEQRAAKEVASLLKQFGWNINNIKKHQDFSNKYCPHRTLDMGWQRLLNMIQSELNGGTVTPPLTGEMYRVRKTWADAASQIGAYSNLDNAKALCDKNPGYSVFNSNGTKIYPVTVTSLSNGGDTIISEYAESGRFDCTVSSIYFREKPYVGSDNPTIDAYYNGESVIYDRVVITTKYNWISWIGGNGARRYMPIKDKATGESWGYCV